MLDLKLPGMLAAINPEKCPPGSHVPDYWQRLIRLLVYDSVVGTRTRSNTSVPPPAMHWLRTGCWEVAPERRKPSGQGSTRSH